MAVQPGMQNEASANVGDPFAPRGEELKGRWDSFLSNPSNRAALIQIGLNLLQPMGAGQSVGGHIGRAIGAGGEASSRVDENRLALAQSQDDAIFDQGRLANDTLNARSNALRAASAAATLDNETKRALFEQYLDWQADLNAPDPERRQEVTFEQFVQMFNGGTTEPAAAGGPSTVEAPPAEGESSSFLSSILGIGRQEGSPDMSRLNAPQQLGFQARDAIFGGSGEPTATPAPAPTAESAPAQPPSQANQAQISAEFITTNPEFVVEQIVPLVQQSRSNPEAHARLSQLMERMDARALFVVRQMLGEMGLSLL